MVEESETVDLAAGEERHRALAPLFPGRVGLVHGRVKPTEKDRAMAGLTGGEIDLLVATTVVEGGVDVPEANVMGSEQAERCVPSPLHQPRDRTGHVIPRSPCA